MGWEAIVLEKAIEKLAEHAIGTLFDNLKQINSKLDLLLEKEFNIALDYLNEYGRSQDPYRKKDIILKSFEYFRESYGVKDLWIRVNSGFGMSVCLLILNDDNEFNFRANQCIADCEKLLAELVREAFRWNPARGYDVLNLLAVEHGYDEIVQFNKIADTLTKNTTWRRFTKFAVRLNNKYLPGNYYKAFYGSALNFKYYIDWKIKYFTCKNILEGLKLTIEQISERQDKWRDQGVKEQPPLTHAEGEVGVVRAMQPPLVEPDEPPPKKVSIQVPAGTPSNQSNRQRSWKRFDRR